MITYSVEKLSDIFDELKPLLQCHYEEIARHKDVIKLNPDYDKYKVMDNAGYLHTVTARDGGKLIGYFVSFVMPHLHYKDCIMSVNDVLFIEKNYRKGFVAMRMFKFAERTLKERGVLKIHINMKIAHDFGILLERIGYVEIERIYEKML